MPRLRKAIFNRQVHFITASVEEGIMLPANPLVKQLILSAMARAYKHHPIEICHYIVNGTHIHMIVIVNNPQDIPGFMERFKTESAHYLNRLLGRRKRTIWCDSYDSPALLTAADVIKKIVYLYTNPVKDGLIDSINHYPGLSSWENYQKSKNTIITSLLSRDDIQKVPQDSGWTIFNNMKNLLLRAAKRKAKLVLNPNGWLRAFNNENETFAEEANTEINQKIKEQEELQAKEKSSFMGKTKLENQGIRLDYQSNRSGKKMWCICSDIPYRIRYILYIKSLCEEAKAVFEKYIQGDFSLPYPPGLFPPRLPLLCNLVTYRG